MTDLIFKFGKLKNKSFSEATERYIQWAYLQNENFVKCFKEDEEKIQNFKDLKKYCDTKISESIINFGKYKNMTFIDTYLNQKQYCLWVLTLDLTDNNNLTLRAFQKFIQNKMLELTKQESKEEIDETIETYEGEDND